MTNILLQVGYVLIYIGCIVLNHYGIVPTGTEIVAVGLLAGHNIVGSISSTMPEPNPGSQNDVSVHDTSMLQKSGVGSLQPLQITYDRSFVNG